MNFHDSARTHVPAILEPLTGRITTLLASATIVVAVTSPAIAATFNVTAGDTSGLIAAIDIAESNGEADTIVLAAGTYTLDAVDNSDSFTGSNGLPVVTTEITIQGDMPANTIIERDGGGPDFRFLNVKEGVLTLDRLTLRGGYLSDGLSAGGGAVYVDHSAVTIRDCVLENNASEGTTTGVGGAIDVFAGTLRVLDSTFNANVAISGGTDDGSGAAIFAFGFNDATAVIIERSLFTGHPHYVVIDTFDTMLAIVDSTLESNPASSGFVDTVISGSGDILLSGTTIASNAASALGGSAKTAVYNSTITGNGREGVGTFKSNVIVNSTITDNVQADIRGKKNLLANVLFDDCGLLTTVKSKGGNVAQSGCDGRLDLELGDLEGVDAMLGSLASNGGPTETLLPMAGSPAIDIGGAYCLGDDQRSRVRPVDGGTAPLCDAGAVEAASASESLLTIDPFLCYQAKLSQGSEKLGVSTVNLVDEFAEDRNYLAGKPSALCAPVELNGRSLLDTDIHLRDFKLKLAKEDPKQSKHASTTRVVNNRFGTVTVETKKTAGLMVPTNLDLASPTTAPNPIDHGVDHFKCYQAKPVKDGPKFDKALLQALAVDQFEQPAVFQLAKITRLCNPVDKNGEGIENSANHLLCYSIKPVKTAPKFETVSGAHLAHQLGNEQVDAAKPKELCVPSETSEP